jgi:hypothetical protein
METKHSIIFSFVLHLSWQNFFIDNDLDFVHDGSTRHLWVQDVLNKLMNNQLKKIIYK